MGFVVPGGKGLRAGRERTPLLSVSGGVGGMSPATQNLEETHMLRWALIAAVVAVVAALLGFTGIAGAAAEIAKILFFLFLAVFAVLLIAGLFAGRKVSNALHHNDRSLPKGT